MSIHTNAARQCFAENIELFANARSEPEKYNLYNGLWNLAGVIAELEEKIKDLNNKLSTSQGR